jgi:hypothetical protein
LPASSTPRRSIDQLFRTKVFQVIEDLRQKFNR